MDNFEVDWLAMQGGGYSPSETNYGGGGYDTFESDWSSMTSGGAGQNEVVAPGSGLSWWDSSATYTPGQAYNPSYTPNYSFTSGTGGAGTPAGTLASGSNFGGVTAGTGSGPQLAPGIGGFGAGSFATTPPTGSAGVTGSFGLMDEPQYGVGRDAYSFAGQRLNGMPQPSAFDRGLDTAGQYAGRAWDATGGAVGRGLSAVGQYAQQNPWAARFAVDAAGLGLGYMNQREANKLAKEQLQLQRETQARNNAIADRINAESTQSLNEARSLYNPQEMGIRAMATEQGNRQTAMNDAAAQMRRRGMSQAAIDAELRRARIGGAAGAATAYTKGLDVGRTAQQSALTSAKGLSQQYGGSPNYGGAEMASRAGAMSTAQMQNLLNTYLYDPVGRTNAQVIDEQQRRVGQS
jgi:hypothetical protein